MLEMTEGALVAASAGEVWRDVTTPAQLTAWFWPPRFDAEAEIDVREQGVWRIRSAVAEIGVMATVIAVDPGRMLRLRWRWDGEEHGTDVEIVLEDAADDATRVIVRHSGFLSTDERASHIEGWSNCLQRLVDRHGAGA